jgi:hypothetical protein
MKSSIGGLRPDRADVGDTAAIFWALLGSGQINLGKISGWQSLAVRSLEMRGTESTNSNPIRDGTRSDGGHRYLALQDWGENEVTLP